MIKIRDWQTYALNLIKYDLVRFFCLNINLTDNIVNKWVQLDRKSLLISFNKWLNSNLKLRFSLILDSIFRLVSILTSVVASAQPKSQVQTPKWLSKLLLAWMPLLLLIYSFDTQALSAKAAQNINGSAPYLTFDGGSTKSTTTNSLLSIKLSDGSIFTPANTSTIMNPIKLPKDGESFNDIVMSIPASANSIDLNKLIGPPNNYWGDDDGDGQGVNGITATGSLSVSITNKNNQKVSRGTVLDICSAPYKVIITSTNGSLTTQYGEPNDSTFIGGSATYYINPNSSPVICYVKPELNLGADSYAGPENVWSSTKGFLPQSTSDYSLNFPTTGANNLYFDLNIGGTGPLTWPPVTKSGITATMTPDNSGTSVRVKLTGPAKGQSQVGKPTLPAVFELVGYDSSDRAVVKYGFVLKQWFVNRGGVTADFANTESWCASLGYRLPHVRDLTNAVCVGVDSVVCQGAVGASPQSDGNYYKRQIGAGLFSEWGDTSNYADAGFVYLTYHTSDAALGGPYPYNAVYPYWGSVDNSYPIESRSGLCTYP